MKAITPIIGIIILLLIAVSLAGSAYTFLSGLFGSYTDKTIKIVPYSENEYKVTIQNFGTATFNTSEIKIFVDGEEGQIFNPQMIQPRQGVTLEFFPPSISIGDNKQIRLVGPTNPITYRTDLTFFPLFSCSQDDTAGFWQPEGLYKMVKDIIGDPGLTCFIVDNTNDVTVNCDLKKMLNNNAGFVVISDNTTIKNCNIETDSVGILILADNVILENNNINVTSAAGSGQGIWIGSVTVTDLTLINNNLCFGNVTNITIGSSNPQRFASGNRCGVDQCLHLITPPSDSNICKDKFGTLGEYNDCDFNCTG